MGRSYEFGYNPFRDFLLISLEYDLDISDKKLKKEIHESFRYILENVLNNPEEVIYLDFEITNNDKYFKLVGKNAITALWLSGIIPSDADNILKSNTFIISDRKYVYNTKKKELTYKLIQN